MKIFVAYPYNLEGYRAALAQTLRQPDYELIYADERIASDHVLRKIEEMLAESDLAIFDLTDANPNVALELGIAIAAEHPYIVAVRKDTVGRLNADIHGWDQVRYDSVEELGITLKRYIERGRAPSRRASYPEEAGVPEHFTSSPLGQKQFPAVSLQPQAVNPDSIFGLQIHPEFYKSTRYTMSNEDDYALSEAEARSRGPQRRWHNHLVPVRGYVDGIHFSSPQPTTQRGDGSVDIPYEQILIDSDGEITIRFRQNDESPIYQFFALLGTGFNIAQDAFAALAVTQKAIFNVLLRLDARRLTADIKLPEYFSDGTAVNLQSQTFSEAFIDLTLRLFRASSLSLSRAEGLGLLEKFYLDRR